MALGTFIKQTRCFLKMTQQEIAQKAGISFQQLSQYEREVRTPKNDTLEKIVGAMGFTLQEFMWMYYSGTSNIDSEENELAKQELGALPEPLSEELSALRKLMNASGYNLTCVNGEYYLTGKHGGYALSDAQVNMLLDGTLKNIGAMCEMMESTLSQQGHSFTEATKSSSEGKDAPEE